MKKIKVLHVIEALGGGVYSYFCDLTQAMGPMDHVETVIVYDDQRDEIIPENIPVDFHPNVRLIKCSMSATVDPIADYKSSTTLKRLFLRERPDIIHLHSSKAGVIGKIAAKRARSKAKLYYTPHGYSFLRKDISHFKTLLFKSIESIMAPFHNCTTIACGDTEFHEARQLHDQVQLIRNGIPYQAIREHLQRNDQDNYTIGILGRITHARNPKFFNNIALANPEVTFLWIGDGILREQITAPNISVTGWFMNREEGLQQLNNIDAYLQTSLWEGLPIAVLEAMAFEKPVIATNVIGNKDIITHKEDGYLINNLKEATQAIQELKDPTLRHHMGKKAAQKVATYFNSLNNFKSLASLYLGAHS